MYLKRLEIHGFKSFADKTVLEFLPPKNEVNSITAVVGPNGSGKSNVSDAIRWVMGEQRMTQLRGKKSEDIIFSGSASKGKMGMASVMMTLDNSDGRADVDFDELVIGRRLYRSGESEYIINNAPVRLLDLQLLLAKAQFGQGSYAIIGQGMIDKLLLQSSAERKAFFDEASGIKEFQIKRHQASLRLARTREHMQQAELLLQEVSPRLKTLSRQVKKLEERKDLETQLTESQESYYATLWTHHQKEQERLSSGIAALDAELAASQEKLTAVQQELASLAHEASRQQAFAALQAEYQSIAAKKHALEREHAMLQGKLQSEYTRSGKHQLGWLEKKVVELKEAQAAIARELAACEEDQQAADKEKTVLSQRAEELALSRTALRSEVSALESKLMQLKSQESAFHITGFRAVQAVLEARKQLPGVHGVVAQLGRVEPEYHMALDVAAGGRLASIVVDHEDDARACVEFLRSGRFGVATFLPLSKIRASDTPGFIRDLLGLPGIHGLASELVDFDEDYRNIFSFVFGNTLVVENFETAKRVGIGRVRMVTLDGDLFETSGAVKGGHRSVKEHGISFADHGGVAKSQERIEAVEDDIAMKREQLESIELDQEQLSAALRTQGSLFDVTASKIGLVQKQKDGIDAELAGLEQELAMHTMSPDEYSEVLADMAQQKKRVEADLAARDAELKEAEARIAQFNDEEEKKKQRVFALQDAMQELQMVVNTLVGEKNDKHVQRAKVETKQEDIQEELYTELRESVHALVERGVPLVEIGALEGLQDSIQKMKYKLSLIGGIDQEVIDEYEQTKQRHDGLTGELDDLHKAVRDLETLIAELDNVMKKQRDKAFKSIRKEFSRYFSMLFDGGDADLAEVYGEEGKPDAEDAGESGDAQDVSVETPEEEGADASGKKKRTKKVLTGIDITACPPGKKIKNIQALSGGERTMTSIALMCAILKTNPSPFVVLDEVEAALDEANTLRVVDIVKELSSASQFVIITHNRVTMHAADALYGVTMGKDGMSKLVSVKMGE